MNAIHRTAVLASIVCLVAALPLWADPLREHREPESDVLPAGTSAPAHQPREDARLDPVGVTPDKWGITLVGRWDVQTGSGAVHDFADYDDLWSDGWGSSLEIFRDCLDGAQVQVGPYASVGVDVFGGGSHTGTDSVVGTVDVEVEDMMISTGLLGIQIQKPVTSNNLEFFWAGKVGAGFAHYSDVDSDLRFRTLGNQVFTDEPFYNSSTTWAFEASARVGIGTRDWSLFLGAGTRIYGAPDSAGRLDPGAGTMQLVPIEVGFELRF